MQDNKSAVESATEALDAANKEYKAAQNEYNKILLDSAKSKAVSSANRIFASTEVSTTAKKVAEEKQQELEAAKKALDEAKTKLDNAKEVLKDAKKFEKEGEKALKELEGKILNSVISKILSTKLSGKEISIKDAIKEETSKDEGLDKTKLTERQKQYLDSMFSGLAKLKSKEELETDLKKLQVEIAEKSQQSQELTEEAKNEIKQLHELKEQIKLCEKIEQLEKTINKEVDRNLDKKIRNSPEYKKIAGAKESLEKLLLNNRDTIYDETYIKNTKAALEAIELKFTAEGTVEWVCNKKDNQEYKEFIEYYYVKPLNEELQAEGSTLAKLNESLKEAVTNIEKNTEVQSLWEKIIEAIKSIFQGKFSEVGKDNVQKAVSRFTDELKKDDKSFEERLKDGRENSKTQDKLMV